MKTMIIQPKEGLTDQKVARIREEAEKKLNDMGIHDIAKSSFKYSEGYLKRKGVNHLDVHLIGVEIMNMAACEALYFCKGWENDSFCRVAREIAEDHNYKILEDRS